MTPEQISHVLQLAFPGERGWSVAEVADLLQSPGIILSGTEQSFVLGRVTLDEAEVLTLATAPDARRQGRAKAALQDFEADLAQAGAEFVFLEVAEDNGAARALYAQAGYDQVGRRTGYYRGANGTSVDALVLRKSLASAPQTGQ